MIRVPWVDRHSDRRVVVGEGAFGELQLAQAHRAGVVEPLRDGAIERGLEVAVDRHARGRWNAGGIAEVFQRDRHAVQGAAIARPHDLDFRLLRLGECQFRRRERIGVQLRVECFHSLQQRLGQFDGRHLAGADEVRDFGEFEVVQVGGVHGGTGRMGTGKRDSNIDPNGSRYAWLGAGRFWCMQP